MASIDELYTEDEYDDGIISMNALEGIRDGNHAHPDINARDAIFKIRYHTRQTQINWK